MQAGIFLLLTSSGGRFVYLVPTGLFSRPRTSVNLLLTAFQSVIVASFPFPQGILMTLKEGLIAGIYYYNGILCLAVIAVKVLNGVE